MSKFASTFAVITGLLGLALTTRTDILYSLSLGGALIAISGALFFVAIKIWEKNSEEKHTALLNELSFKDVNVSLVTTNEILSTLSVAQNVHIKQILEQIFENRSVSLKSNMLLEQLVVIIQTEVKTLIKQQENFYKTALELSIKSFDSNEEYHLKIKEDLAKLNEIVSMYNLQIIEQMKVSHNIAIKSNEILGQIPSTIQSEVKVFAEQQQHLSQIILEDIPDMLSEFAENQSRNADDIADNIKRTMRLTNDALKELPLSLEMFNVQNAETIKKATEGYKQFESFIKTILEQVTSISNQDYELLKGMIK